MKIRIILFFISIFLFNHLTAQHLFRCIIKEASSNENLQRVTATIAGNAQTTISDDKGMVSFLSLPQGNITIIFSFIGHIEKKVSFQIPQTDTIPVILLEKAEAKTEEEVIITSSRTNSRIEDLPTKVEVIGSEEVEEEATTIPGNIAALLGDVAGIQNQRTSATTGSIDLRIQGLSGNYTQLLRDGLPLFGGYSGGFSLLQIPPLDLKQIEIIKGASSTLYGGGAIAGMINIISKTPKLNDPQHSVLVNYSTLNEFNLNTFHSGRNKKIGYTLFAGTTLQRATDVNKDGFSDVPDLKTLLIHPKLFLYPNAKNTVTLEFDGSFEDRTGGDMQVLHKTKDSLHQFFIQNTSNRYAIAGTWKNQLNKTSELNFKGLFSFFNRNINTNVFGMKASQQIYFTELSYLKKWEKHTLVSGINISGESFQKKLPDSSGINPGRNGAFGIFIQNDWKIIPKLTLQSGVRVDFNTNYDPVILPRISLLYKLNHQFTSRLGGGMGYKIPSVFNNDLDERELRNHNLSAGILTEKSIGANWDVNYKNSIGDWHITINQMFYVTQIDRPVIPANNSLNYNYINAKQPLSTKGFETYIAIRHDELEIYMGYTYAIAKQFYNKLQPNVPLIAKSKFAAVISNEFSPRLRACIEASYTGKQFLDDGSKTPGYFITAGMIRFDIKKLSLVLNCENILDYRQTRKESIVVGSVTNPSFKQLWGPIDGRVINLSVKYSW